MLLNRWQKRSAYMNRKLRRYFGYAAGEILLVIAGILIALEIDNWNSDRKDAATLDNYLQSIARNMRDDADMLERLHATRSESVTMSTAAANYLLPRPFFSVEQIQYLNAAMRLAGSTTTFSPNTSGFDALKNSGVLDGLQGKDIGQLLSRYYVGINRVLQLERDHNARIRELMSLPVDSAPDFVESFAFTNPQALQPGRFDDLQTFYSAYFGSGYPGRLFEMSVGAAGILREYDELVSIAHMFIEMAEHGKDSFDNEMRERLAELDALDQGAGYADVIRNGALSVGYYEVSFGYPYYLDGEFIPLWKYVDHNSMRNAGDVFRLSHRGGTSWAVLSLIVRAGASTIGRAAADYTRFDRILLEARGAEGGERLQFHLKDSDDPDDGTQTNVEIVLGDDWETYVFELSEFETADVSSLHVAPGFLTLEQQSPITFFVRNLKFLEPDDEVPAAANGSP